MGQESQHVDNTPEHTNRLIHETSPYLLQHAHNPVDWYPWGPEAFERAQGEDKPILLSIGYSACHWCHVMAHESFENVETAELMNREYISIKVDREERPDVDALYMEATLRMTGSGGWPMTVFLMPDGAPFLAGTYFPPVDRHGLLGFPKVLVNVAQWYRQSREEVEEQAQALREIYQHEERRVLEAPQELLTGAARLNPAVLGQAANADLERFDPVYGGLQRAPKFPHSLGLEFLLRMEQRRQTRGAGDAATQELRDDLLTLVTLTLDNMAAGGIYDQVGGGFHRYATDETWLTPHFEKMLYDNALLALVYLRAWQVIGHPRYRSVCEEILDYVLREMTDPSGAFYSSQDADSEGQEGKFYVWTLPELREALDDADFAVAQLVWNPSTGGNFEGKNILAVARSEADVARKLGISEAEVQDAMARIRARLYAVRSARIWPGRDDKAITAWNALMLRAMAEAAGTLGREDYRQAAARNATFLMTEMAPEGKLRRTWRVGRAKIDAYLEDYAALANALLSMYELTGQSSYVERARALMDETLRRFWDEETGGFFDTATDHERLIGRPRELYDNVTPSGTSLAAEALLRLGALTGESAYHEHAAKAAFAVAPLALQTPSGFGRLLCALDDLIGPFYEVALVGEASDPRMQALVTATRERWHPRIAVARGKPDDAEALRAAPLLTGRPLVDGAPAAYVCQGFVCQRPVTTPEALRSLLEA